MEEMVKEENREAALAAVKRNRGAPGIDRMKVGSLARHHLDPGIDDAGGRDGDGDGAAMACHLAAGALR